MFERIFAGLLRLYPSRFRRDYEGEARQLLRERFRDETGLLRGLRLCLDLILDIAVGLPQAYWTTPKAPATAPVRQHVESTPSFRLLADEKTHLGSFLVGSLLTLTTLSLFSFLLSHEPAFRSHSGPNNGISPIEAVIQRLNQPLPTGTTVQQREEIAGSGIKGSNALQVKGSALGTPAESASRSERAGAFVRRFNQSLPVNPLVQQQQVIASNPTKGSAPPHAKASSLPITVEAPSRSQNNSETSAQQKVGRSVTHGFSGGFHAPLHGMGNLIVGDWQGTLKDSQQERRLFVKISQPRAGTLTVLFEYAGKEKQLIEARPASFEDGILKFTIHSIGATYKGGIASDGKSIVGTWEEGAISRPLQLSRIIPHTPLQPAAH